MLTSIAIVLAVLAAALGVLLIRASRQPDSFSYARSITIAAPPERIFPHIADPRAFNVWNPFNEEPTLKGSYSGPAQGPGARYTFESKRAGCGYTEITGIDAPRSLHVRLVMTRPIACDNRIEFRLAPVSGGTQVTWGMSGAMPFVSKVMNQVIDCEKMCTGQFDRGLAKLKGIVEGERVGGPERVA